MEGIVTVISHPKEAAKQKGFFKRMRSKSEDRNSQVDIQFRRNNVIEVALPPATKMGEVSGGDIGKKVDREIEEGVKSALAHKLVELNSIGQVLHSTPTQMCEAGLKAMEDTVGDVVAAKKRIEKLEDSRQLRKTNARKELKIRQLEAELRGARAGVQYPVVEVTGYPTTQTPEYPYPTTETLEYPYPTTQSL